MGESEKGKKINLFITLSPRGRAAPPPPAPAKADWEEARREEEKRTESWSWWTVGHTQCKADFGAVDGIILIF